jgi:hypothetical protein
MDDPAESAPRPGLLGSVWFRGGLGIAAAEAILIAVGTIPRWPAIGVAVALLLLYFIWGRTVRHATARQAIWAVAVSQALVLLVPIALWAIGAAVIVALAAIAAVLVVVLIVDR